MPDGANRWVRSNRVLWRRTTTGLALLPPGSEPPLTLTGSGALLWDLADVPLTLTETAAIIAERFGIDVAGVTADLAPVLEELSRRGVFVPAGGPP